MKSKDSYDNQEGAQRFLRFLNSPDGQTHQEVLYEAFRRALGKESSQKILDAASGPGWLAAKLQPEFPNIECCDGSAPFLARLKEAYPNLPARHVDLNQPLPYRDNEFDTLIFSMAAQDLEDQQKTFSEFSRILKPGGRLLAAITNPYYAYPVGVWKRGLLGYLLGRKPKLKVRSYHGFSKRNRNYRFQESIESYFYTMPEYLNNITASGFSLRRYEDLESKEDGSKGGFKYQLHRFPVLLFMKFEKPGK